jgi:hypothetical protein
VSRDAVLSFLVALRDDPDLLARYERRSLPQVLFHARNEGFPFTAEDLADVAGALEGNVILNLDRDPFDGTARLWRRMWGHRHLEYLVEHVVRRHGDRDLALVAVGDADATRHADG